MSDAVSDSTLDGLYRLDEDTTRRKFLSALAASGVGLAGLRNATERAFGEKPDGVPLVWRYDKYGNPETVRYVPEECHRRIMAYYDLDPGTVYDRTESVNGISLEQRSDDPTDLTFKVYVDDNNRSVRRDLPNRIQKIPVTLEERVVDREFGRVCDRRSLNFYDPLPANPEIDGYDGDGTYYGTGTLGVVYWNDNPDNAYECYITAAHVVESNGSYADYLRHEGAYNGSNCEEDVGAYANHSAAGDYGMDVAKYRRRSGTVTADIRGNADDSIGDLAGT